MLYALILAGGKGTRLYPLSRESNPKQFLRIIDDKSFLRSTVDRVKRIVNKDNIFIVTNESYIDKIKEEINEIHEENIFIEPENKETAACIGFSAIKLMKKDKDAVMLIFPSDHYIDGEKYFLDTLYQAIEFAEKKRYLVTIGIEPLRPETGYGYIQMGEALPSAVDSYKVNRFTEKPNLEVAKDFILEGDYLWNSGMFIWRADVFLREMEKYLPKLYDSFMKIYQSLGTEKEEEETVEQYGIMDGISVDFGIMQKTRKAVVVKSRFQWDDIGTFQSLSRFLIKNSDNYTKGETYLEDSKNCIILGESKMIIGFGLKDMIIVQSGDIILVMDSNRDQEIKHLVNNIKRNTNMKKYI